MTEKNKLNRRDFLKLGSLAAISLPAITKVGKIGDDDLLESKEAYGGFLVRTLSDGESSITVDDSFYKRFDAKDVIFSRIMWDQDYIERLNNVEEVFKSGDPGYLHIDVALGKAAGYVSQYNGTNSPMMGQHAGLLTMNPDVTTKPGGASFEGRWEHSHLSPEEVSNVVKKAAKFLGASLVGIAPMNERWIYSNSYDLLAGGAAPINFTKVEKVVLPEGQVTPKEAGELIKAEMSKLEGEQIKAFVLDVIENTDPALMPPGSPPPGIVKMLPASQVKNNLSMFTKLPVPVLSIFAEKLGLDFEIASAEMSDTELPHYLEDGTLNIPETMKTVIVLAFEMDHDSMEAAPTKQGDHGAMQGYSKMAITAGSLAVFIKSLGYNAIPCGNNTGISVPQAIEAGLGEGGRNGILITPKYGPRVRLSKVITDMPMAYDKPIKFGVEEFCKVCKKCAKLCPTQAISYGEKTMEPSTISTNPGVLKWSVNAEECYFGWTANGSGCGNCIRVCPFNKPEGWLHEATRILIGAKSGSLDSIMVKLDEASGYGASEPKFGFWGSDQFIHIK